MPSARRTASTKGFRLSPTRPRMRDTPAWWRTWTSWSPTVLLLSLLRHFGSASAPGRARFQVVANYVRIRIESETRFVRHGDPTAFRGGPKTCSVFWTSSVRGAMRPAPCRCRATRSFSSMASLADMTVRKLKASPQPSNPVVTLTSKESAAGRCLSPQAQGGRQMLRYSPAALTTGAPGRRVRARGGARRTPAPVPTRPDRGGGLR